MTVNKIARKRSLHLQSFVSSSRCETTGNQQNKEAPFLVGWRVVNATGRIKPSRHVGSAEGVCGVVFLDSGRPVGSS